VTIPLPRLSAPELRRRLLRLGFVEDRQKGSHLLPASILLPVLPVCLRKGPEKPAPTG
jgi:hypothetical protein